MTQRRQQLCITAVAFLGLALTIVDVDAGAPLPPPTTEVRTAGDLVVQHVVHVNRADDLPGLDQLDSVRYAELAGELRPCR